MPSGKHVGITNFISGRFEKQSIELLFRASRKFQFSKIDNLMSKQ